MGGPCPFVMALTVFDNELVAGGAFDYATAVTGSRSYNPHIAAWDGSSWSSLGSGTNNYVRTLEVFDNELIVGGDFTTAGEKAAAHIAAWTKPFTDVSDDERRSLPVEYELSQNCPNPFNSTTTIECSLPRRSHVVIDVYDLLGRRIKSVFDGESEAGKHTFFWNGTDHSGRTVGTGVYFYRIKAGDYIDSKKMLFLK